MTCPEERVVAFLAGELPEDEERSFDAHLLVCESCWRAVQADRAGRLALELLREPAPPGLQGRVALSVGLAADERPRRSPTSRRASGVAPTRSHRRRPRRLAAGLLLAGALAVLGVFLARGGPTSDPPQVAAVAAMVTPGAAPSPALRAGEHLVIARQPLMVRAYVLDGVEAIVATSSRPFAIPPASHLFSGSSQRAWMAMHGQLSMYGVNRGLGRESMFVVAPMPMAELPEVAAHLHLL